MAYSDSIIDDKTANPVLASTTRGAMIESIHRGAVALVRLDGVTELAVGDVDRPVFARSAIKPLQALPLVESGAVDSHGLSAAHIALACSSHGGEPRHADTVVDWLRRLGLAPSDLECGAHWPYHPESARALAASGGDAGPQHNNCSGKHSGFLTTACYFGESTSGYTEFDHPVQRRVRTALADMTDTDLSNAPVGIDGCGIPVLGISLRATAYAMARLAAASAGDTRRQTSLERIFDAFVSHPYMVAGSGRFCSAIVQACQRRALVKTGAEGVYCAALPGDADDGRGALGIALKIDDGATRAAEVVTAALLNYCLNRNRHRVQLDHWLRPTLRNVAKRDIGYIECRRGWLP